jgi:octaprenyl-diphosphate synthase
MPSLKTIQAPIATELKKVNRVIRQALSSDVRMLNLILRYVMRSKGKQMRPTLVLL